MLVFSGPLNLQLIKQGLEKFNINISVFEYWFSLSVTGRIQGIEKEGAGH